MANSYHMEALRKQRLLDRKNEALRRLESQGSDLTKAAVMDGYLSKKTPKESVLITDGGQFDQQRQNPESLLAKNLRKGFDFSQNRKHRLEINSVPNLPPPTILAIQRDHVYKIFHPYDFHTKNQGGNGHNYHKHINFSNVPSDKIYPILHPKPVFKVPVPELPCRKEHFKV